MLVVELLNVRGGAAGGVDADEVLADFFVGRDGRVDALGDKQVKLFRNNSVGGELPKAEGRRSPAGEHDGQAALGAEDGGVTLVDVRKAAVSGLWLLEAAIVEADDG